MSGIAVIAIPSLSIEQMIRILGCVKRICLAFERNADKTRGELKPVELCCFLGMRIVPHFAVQAYTLLQLHRISIIAWPISGPKCPVAASTAYVSGVGKTS